MFVGFIAVIIVLLIVVFLMSTGGSNSDGSKYAVEARKVQTVIANLRDETKFYSLAHNGSYTDLSIDYFKNLNFSKGLIMNDTLNRADWDGYPTDDVDGGMSATYTGASIKLGGTAGDQMRIIVKPVNQGRNAVFFIMKKKDNNIPEEYLRVLEMTMSSDENYIGG